MKENKKQQINEEKNKKPEAKLPLLNFGYLGTAYIHTDKGMCMWMTPNSFILEDSIEYLKYTLNKYEEALELNKKKKEEEAKNKPPVENKEKEYKPVK